MMKKRKSRSGTAAKEEPEQGKAAPATAAKEEAREEEKKEEVEEEEEGWRKRAGLMVSEQVPLGAMWLPSWDVGNMAQSEFYSDVWDGYHDIWGLRTPFPPAPT